MRSSAPSPRSSPRPSSAFATARGWASPQRANSAETPIDFRGLSRRVHSPDTCTSLASNQTGGTPNLAKAGCSEAWRKSSRDGSETRRECTSTATSRYDGRPTRLVSDGGKRGYDPPQNGVRMAPPAAPQQPEAVATQHPFSYAAHSGASEVGARSLGHGRAPGPRTHPRTARVRRLSPARAATSCAVHVKGELAQTGHWCRQRAPSLRLAAGSQRPPRLATVRRRHHCSRVSTWVRQIPLGSHPFLSDPDQSDHRLGLFAVEQFLGRHGRIGR